MEEKQKEMTPEEMSAKITEVEGKLAQLTKERDDALQQRDALQKQVNGLRITGLTKQVETNVPQQKEEPISFDFDL